MIRTKTGYWFMTILTLFLAAIWTWASAAPDAATTSGLIPAPKEGFLAPEFDLETIDGQSVRLSDLRGNPVLINLWASWCPPCRAEMPAMERVYQEYRHRGFTILAVNVTNQDSIAAAAAFTQAYGLTYPILLDVEGAVSRQYQLRSLPTSFFVDSQGIIREVIIGGPMSEALLRTHVERLLEGSE